MIVVVEKGKKRVGSIDLHEAVNVFTNKTRRYPFVQNKIG